MNSRHELKEKLIDISHRCYTREFVQWMVDKRVTVWYGDCKDACMLSTQLHVHTHERTFKFLSQIGYVLLVFGVRTRFRKL
jgi:hypothetical protein